MKQILTLVALSLLFIGAAAAETVERNICPETECILAEAQGLYDNLDLLSSSIDKGQSTLEQCPDFSKYCSKISENAEIRKELVREVQSSALDGEFRETSRSLEVVRSIVLEDIQSSERELEEGDADEGTVRRILELEKDILKTTESSLETSQRASVVSIANSCPADRCGDEVSQAAKNIVKFKAGAELSKSANLAGFQDLDSDGDGTPEVMRTEDLRDEQTSVDDIRSELSRTDVDGNVYCWGRTCEAPSRAELGEENSVYCWGRSCEVPSEVMQTNYDGSVYCWGNRCETPSTEKSVGEGTLYCWGRSCQASEAVEDRDKERTDRNPQTEKEHQSAPDESDSEQTTDSESRTEEETGTVSNPSVEVQNDPPTTSPGRGVRNSLGYGFEKATSTLNNLFSR